MGRFSAVSLCHEKLENTRFHSARRAAMSGKERDQGVPSSSGRRERRPRGENTPRARMRGQRGLAGRVVRGPLAISFAGAVLKQEFNRFLRLYARPRRYGFH